MMSKNEKIAEFIAMMCDADLRTTDKVVNAVSQVITVQDLSVLATECEQ